MPRLSPGRGRIVGVTGLKAPRCKHCGTPIKRNSQNRTVEQWQKRVYCSSECHRAAVAKAVTT